MNTGHSSFQDNQNELYFWVVKAGTNRLYYLNVKEDKNGKIYLVIKEVKTNDDGSKEIHRIMIFEKDLRRFVTGFKKVLQFINERGVEIEWDENNLYENSHHESNLNQTNSNSSDLEIAL